MVDDRRPNDLKLFVSEQDIRNRINELSVSIQPWLDGKGQTLALCVLRGAVHFYSDLVRAFSVSVEHAFCRASSYNSKTNAKEASSVALELDAQIVSGRKILVVDDICDTGDTLQTMEENLQASGALEMKSVVLVRRAQSAFIPDWIGFEVSDDSWLVGYGMEDSNAYANLRCVYKKVTS